jgi:tetratricopeptide (TPR) repeat protein
MKPIGSRIQLKKLNRMSKRFFFLVLIAIIPLGIMSFSTPFRDAELQRANGNYHAAMLQYEKALAKKPNKADKAYILFQMAECSRNLMEWEQALKYYDRAVKAGYPDDIVYLRRADAKRYKGDYAGALEDYKEYQVRAPSDPAGKVGEESCELATQWVQRPVKIPGW